MTRDDRAARPFAESECERVPCAICGATDTRPAFVKFNLVIGRCRRCGLVYANPRLRPEDIHKRYDREYFWHEYLPASGAPGGRVDLDAMDRHHQPMLDLLRREAPPPARMLEIGTGAGVFLKTAERAGWDVVGIELSREAAQFARGLGLDVREETAERMSVEPESCDVVVMFDTIEHLLDPMSVVRTVRRVLRPRGAVVITTPNLDAVSRLFLGRDWAILSPAEHLYYFTERSLGALVEAAGFSRVRFERRFAVGWRETMNPANTHRAAGVRRAAYEDFVEVFGPMAFRRVQDLGRADQLVCVAYAG